MRMSIQNTFPSYQSLTVALNQQSVALTAAEMHGLISGLLCGGSRDAGWQALVHDLTNEGVAFPQALSQPLQQLYEVTRETLEDDEFLFQLMLPEGEIVSVFDRADALAGWVNHFLLGLGMMQPKLAQMKDEVGEGSTICATSRSWATTKTKIRKNWSSRWKKWRSMCGSPPSCATANSPVTSQRRRKTSNRRCTKRSIAPPPAVRMA